MALTTNKKNKIIAEWKAGLFTSFNAVAVEYKIDPKTVKKILYGIKQSNTELVEVGAIFTNAKNSIKNPHELKAIDKAILERTTADEIEALVMDGTLKNVKSIIAKIEGEEVETMRAHRHAQETLDKALITSGKAPRHAPKVEINNNNDQTNLSPQFNLTVTKNGH